MRYSELTALSHKLIEIARMAGDAVMAVYLAGDQNIQNKGDLSPVTQADLDANELLIRLLSPLIINCPVVSEEDENSHVYLSRVGMIWLIDPLDGTKEFIARSGEFTINIALIKDGCSVLGVVYAPAIDLLYWGGPSIGAFRLTQNNAIPIKVAQNDSTHVCRVVASKSHLNKKTMSFINNLSNVFLVQAGSSLKFCKIAEGEAEIYPRLAPTFQWDTAAAQAVLEGAGGFVLNLRGLPLRYGRRILLNPSFIATSDVRLIHK